MAVENKRLNTRILLKYDTYENWSTNNPNLLKGEMAIAVIDVSENTQTHTGQAVPQLLVKVGNGLEGDAGKYNSLPFISGLAADVHSWAKAASKPSYAISEISGAKEYQTVQGTDEYTWILQARKAGSSDAWENVSIIDLAKISTRIKAVEDRMDTAEDDIDNLEDTVGDDTKGLVKDVAALKAAVGEGGSVADAITNAINGLDSTKTQAAGTDGLALSVVQENGIITSISGSIAAETYDKFNAAKEAVEALNATVSQTAGTDGLAITITQEDGKLTGVTANIAAETYDAYGAAEAAVNALDMAAAVEGTQEGTVVKFIDKVNQTNGLVEAELGELVFNSAYNAQTNKAATMADVTGAVADLNGAMHFEGFTTTDPDTGITIEGKPDYVAAAGDVVIYGTIEYVYDGSKWNKLGEEGALGTAIENLKGNSTGAVSKTVTAHTQANGVVTLTYSDIQIDQSQVTGLSGENGELTRLEKKIDDEISRSTGADTTHTNAINTINGADTGKSMREVAGEVATNSLGSITNTSIVAPNANQTIKLIKQTNGVVEATAQDIQLSGIGQVTGLTEALNLKATEEDLTKAEERITANENAITKLNGADNVAGSVANSIKTAIEGLDKADTAVAGQFVTAVSEENGVITVSRGAVNVKDLEQTVDTYVVFDCGSASVNI